MLNTAAVGACSLLGIATAGMMWFWQDDAALVAAAREQAAAERAHAEAAQSHAEQAMEVAVAGQQEAHAAVAQADAAREHAHHAEEAARVYAHAIHSQAGGGDWSSQEPPGHFSDQSIEAAGLATQPAGQYRYAYPQGDWRQESAAGEALAAYREADSDDDRAEAREKLAETLGEEYDAIIEQHEEHLKQMEERLEKLRDQLAKRREARDSMVELRVEALTSEADGLGWPTPPNGAQHVWGVPLFAPSVLHAASLPGEPGVWSLSPAGGVRMTQPAPAFPSVPGVDMVPPSVASPADAPEPASRPARRPRSGGARTQGTR